MKKVKVYLTGGENLGWALDEDLRLTRLALEDVVELSSLKKCDVIHSVWWEGLLTIPHDHMIGKRIFSYVPGEPFRMLAAPKNIKAMSVVSQWLTGSTQGTLQFESLGIRPVCIPYMVDTSVFLPMKKDDPELLHYRREWNIPEGKYLIGSFQRDTEGSDLRSPKLVKGPDLFAEIVSALHKKGHPVHVVLAGPRRHWLRRCLTDRGIPFTYIGKTVQGDDNSVNILDRRLLNILYNTIALYIVGSRSEGAPNSILEAAASQCPIVSTKVGIAPDVLAPNSLFDSISGAVAIIEREIHANFLKDTIAAQYQNVQKRHRPEAVRDLFKELYAGAERVPPFHKTAANARTPDAEHPRRLRWIRRLLSPATDEKFVVSLWHNFHKPPYGGGNQFMLALKKGFQRRGICTVENRIHGANVHVLQAIGFNFEKIIKAAKKTPLKIVHRIDGPIHLIRGFDREKDELCFRLNSEFASATILQSAWSYLRIREMGFEPVNPVIIHNGVDTEIFHRQGRVNFDPWRKVRLISSSWSDNPRKGGQIYKWIESNLDWTRYEYTFVGRCSERFERIRHIPPTDSEQLGNILRQHDIYITASKNDPCSNAVVEALACGLPTLYFNDGGHPELVGYGGLPFNNVDEIFPKLADLTENYDGYQRLIVVKTMDEVAEKYLEVLRGIV